MLAPRGVGPRAARCILSSRMHGDDLASRISELVVRTARLDIDPAALAPDQRLAGPESLGLHSLQVFELVTALEDEFRIQVSDEAIAGLNSVAAITEYVRAHRAP